MTEALSSGLTGAGCSLALLALEVGVMLLFSRTNTQLATIVVLGVFVVAFTGRLVLLLLAPKVSIFGAHDSQSFGLGVVFSFLLGVAFEAVLWAKTKR